MEHGDVSLVTFLIPGQRVTPEYKDADAEAFAKRCVSLSLSEAKACGTE